MADVSLPPYIIEAALRGYILQGMQYALKTKGRDLVSGSLCHPEKASTWLLPNGEKGWERMRRIQQVLTPHCVSQTLCYALYEHSVFKKTV